MIIQLISWPTTLTEFCFDKPSNAEIYRIEPPMIHSWLQIHNSTLKSIKIGELSSQRTQRTKPAGYRLGFDAAKFPNLEILHLSRWLWNSPLGLDLAAKEDALLLLGAPRLRRFVWDFTTHYDTYREYWTEFNAKRKNG